MHSRQVLLLPCKHSCLKFCSPKIVRRRAQLKLNIAQFKNFEIRKEIRNKFRTTCWEEKQNKLFWMKKFNVPVKFYQCQFSLINEPARSLILLFRIIVLHNLFYIKFMSCPMYINDKSYKPQVKREAASLPLAKVLTAVEINFARPFCVLWAHDHLRCITTLCIFEFTRLINIPVTKNSYLVPSLLIQVDFFYRRLLHQVPQVG